MRDGPHRKVRLLTGLLKCVCVTHFKRGYTLESSKAISLEFTRSFTVFQTLCVRFLRCLMTDL